MIKTVRPLWLLFLLCLVEVAHAQSAPDLHQQINLGRIQLADDLYRQADDAYSQRQFAQAAELYVQAFDAGFEIPEIAYNAASCYSLSGDKTKAFAYLAKTVAMGATDPNQVKNDPDLLPLHDDQRWQGVLHGLEENQGRYKEEQAVLWESPSLSSPFKPQLTEDERVAGLSKLWSEVKYNFVYPERLVEIDWDKLYLSYLPKVRAAKSTYEYYRLLEALCAMLRDSHTNVYHPMELVGSVGLHTRLIEDKVMVIEVWDPDLRHQGILPGMEVVEIDGIPAHRYAEQDVAPYQSASTRQDLEVRTFEYALLTGAAHKPVRLTLRGAPGQVITRTIRRRPFRELAPFLPKTPGFELRMLSGNIGYVALNSFGDNAIADEFMAAYDKIAKTDGLILDLRNNGGGNSGVGMRILATLIDQPVALTPWQTRDYKPIFRAWGRPIGMPWIPGGYLLPDKKLHYTKPVLVLTSPRTFSAAEDFLVAFDQSKRGTIVGEPSAGSTGQPLNFKLPGGGSGRVCTWRGTYADGRPFLGVGVQPQKLVLPTLRDFRAGKDTVLEAALAELLQPLGEK